MNKESCLTSLQVHIGKYQKEERSDQKQMLWFYAMGYIDSLLQADVLTIDEWKHYFDILNPVF